MKQQELKNEASLTEKKIKDAKLFNEPFKHIVIDNFFSNELANECLKNFPDNNNKDSWERENNEGIEIKSRTIWKSEFDIPEGIVDAVRVMNSSIFLKAMSEKLGIKKIIPDPYFSGGGLNLTTTNGLLDIHVDGNYHDASGLNRRLNAIVYLNPDWEENWGGEFELWDNDVQNCVKKVLPLFNRLVIFDSHDLSYHGSPEPLKCPEGIGRKSIILYYYTKETRPNEQILVEKPHSALWKKKGFTDKRGNKTRDYEG